MTLASGGTDTVLHIGAQHLAGARNAVLLQQLFALVLGHGLAGMGRQLRESGLIRHRLVRQLVAAEAHCVSDGLQTLAGTLQNGHAALVQDPLDLGMEASGGVVQHDHRLIHLFRGLHGGAGHDGVLGHLTLRHAGGHILHHQYDIRLRLGGGSQQAGLIEFLDAAGAPCIQRIIDIGIGGQQALNHLRALVAPSGEAQVDALAHVGQQADDAAGQRYGEHTVALGQLVLQRAQQLGGLEHFVQIVHTDQAQLLEQGILNGV